MSRKNGVIGVENVLKMINKGLTEITVEHRKIVKKHGAIIQKAAKRGAVVDTGFMRNQITLKNHGNKFVSTTTITSEADYGIYVEKGTIRMPAQPYMKPAYDSNIAAFLDDMNRLVGRG